MHRDGNANIHSNDGLSRAATHEIDFKTDGGHFLCDALAQMNALASQSNYARPALKQSMANVFLEHLNLPADGTGRDT